MLIFKAVILGRQIFVPVMKLLLNVTGEYCSLLVTDVTLFSILETVLISFEPETVILSINHPNQFRKFLNQNHPSMSSKFYFQE